MCPTRYKKLAFIYEKELLVVDAVEVTDEEEIDGSNHNEEEYLGALDLLSHVVHRVLTRTKKELLG